MAKIYVVIGATGEYDDSCEWMVIAYTTSERAQEHADNAQKEADQIRLKSLDNYKARKFNNPFDPKMRMDYNGTTYSIEELELVKNK